MLRTFFSFIARWHWGQKLVMTIMIAAGATFFDFVSLWPTDGEYFHAIVFATNEYFWKSCMSSWREEDGELPQTYKKVLGSHDSTETPEA